MLREYEFMNTTPRKRRAKKDRPGYYLEVSDQILSWRRKREKELAPARAKAKQARIDAMTPSERLFGSVKIK